MLRRLVLVLAIAVSLGCVVVGNVLAVEATPFLGDGTGGYQLFLNAINVLALTSIAVGAVLRLRVPSNPIGIAMIAGALGIQLVFVGWPLLVTAELRDWQANPALAVVSWIPFVAVNPSLFVLFGVVGVLFPDGHLPGRRWRVPMAAVTGALVAGEVLRSLNPWWAEDLLSTAPADAFAALAELGGTISTAALCAGLGLAVLALVVRFRRAGAVQRAQIKWLAAALALFAVALPISLVTEIGPTELVDLVSILIGCLTPIAIGIAILRYRLYEIDRLVSRTVSWALITGGLFMVFWTLLIALQTVFTDAFGGSTVAVAVSTLVAAALFQPLRSWVQRAVDRRFDRARVDGEHLAEAFAQRLSAEVDLDTLAAELRMTAGVAVRPASATIWLADRGAR